MRDKSCHVDNSKLAADKKWPARRSSPRQVVASRCPPKMPTGVQQRRFHGVQYTGAGSTVDAVATERSWQLLMCDNVATMFAGRQCPGARFRPYPPVKKNVSAGVRNECSVRAIWMAWTCVHSGHGFVRKNCRPQKTQAPQPHRVQNIRHEIGRITCRPLVMPEP